ncbi:MAG: DUF4374 domain-containing protein [Bacteroidales bacterium]|nr:DUF4374 domain-containing protein [Bacteroidales bacterium]
MNKTIKIMAFAAMCVSASMGFVACNDSDDDEVVSKNGKYVVNLGITGADNVTVYYTLSVDNLMGETISAAGQGIEQEGYHDFTKGGSTVFSIGGMGVNECSGFVRDAEGNLTMNGNFVFDNTLNEIVEADGNKMIALDMPGNAEVGTNLTFYHVNQANCSIEGKETSISVAPMNECDWPSITGMAYSRGYVYISYMPMNSNTYATEFTDTAYICAYSYPDMKLAAHIKDARTGNIGTWNASNGIVKDENGDLYLMSSSAIGNGFSKATKGAAFLRIKNGALETDADYFFDFSAATAQIGLYRPSHILYLGGGLALVEVSSLSDEEDARWSDLSRKTCIVDLYNKTVCEVSGIPVHNGDGGRRFAATYSDGYAYLSIQEEGGRYIYQVDPKSATAVRGAKLSATFLAGLFAL